MSLKSVFGTNKEKETAGAWVVVHVNDDGSECRFKLARMTDRNRNLTKIAASKRKLVKGRRGNVDEDDVYQKALETFVEGVLFDWENVVEFRKDKITPQFPTEGVQMMPYNKENALWLLQELPDLFELLAKEATNIANFQDEENDETAKNS